MKAIIAILIALALMLVPALAFTPTIPTSTIEAITDSYTKDTATYSYERYVVEEDNVFTPQYAYSGVLFGADQGEYTDPNIGDHEGYTAAVVGNVITTDATDVTSDITRQYIQQGGSAYITQVPGNLVYDPENQETPQPTITMGFTKSNLAWVSGDLTSYSVDADSYAAVGGNYLETIPTALSPYCQNAWLIEREDEQPITISAVGSGTSLLDAYAGTASKASLTMYPGVGDLELEDYNGDGVPETVTGTGTAPKALMSGYAERFAGYDGAEVNQYDDIYSAGSSLGENKIVMDFGDNSLVENFWIMEGGVDFDAPTYADFPLTSDPITDADGTITWADEGSDDVGFP